MNPREEARKLVERMMKHCIYEDTMSGTVEVDKYVAKECAMIAVDEIIKDHDNIIRWSSEKAFKFGVKRNIDGWKDVKREIERL